MKINFSKQTINRLEGELVAAQRLNNLRLYKRVMALLLISGHVHKDDVGNLLNMNARTIYNWFLIFASEGFSWLLGYHYRGRGRKPKISKEQKKKLYTIVEEGPEKYGFDCGVWNSAMILVVIQKEFNVTYNPRYLCTLLKSIGLTYQKAKFISDRLDDEEHQKKRKEWEDKIWPEILKKAKEINAVILFTDEVSFAQWGSLARTWSPRGKQPVVKTCGKRKGLKMFGTIEFKNGGFQYMECDGKFNGESYVVFLKQVLSGYSCPVILIEDGAPYHKGKVVKEFKKEMENENHLFVYGLPSYSPDKIPLRNCGKILRGMPRI